MSKPITLEGIEAAGFKRGVEAAADLADSYNGCTDHSHMLGDCILGKLNLTKRKSPRPNKARQPLREAEANAARLYLAACDDRIDIVESGKLFAAWMSARRALGLEPIR